MFPFASRMSRMTAAWSTGRISTAPTLTGTLSGSMDTIFHALLVDTPAAFGADAITLPEVYLIKYDDKAPAQLVVGCHAYIRRADHFPDYRGFSAGITVIRGDGMEPIQKEPRQ